MSSGRERFRKLQEAVRMLADVAPGASVTIQFSEAPVDLVLALALLGDAVVLVSGDVQTVRASWTCEGAAIVGVRSDRSAFDHPPAKAPSVH